MEEAKKVKGGRSNWGSYRYFLLARLGSQAVSSSYVANPVFATVVPTEKHWRGEVEKLSISTLITL